MPGDTTDSSMRLSRVEAEEADGRASDSVQESARPKLRQDRSPVSYDSQLPPTNSGPDSTRSARPLLATVLVLRGGIFIVADELGVPNLAMLVVATC